jgi:uncharacterized SAM-dependent methyltransferase
MVAKQHNKINDLIFKELIKRGYSLEGNTRIWNIADSKLWYLTPDQAQAYLDLENSDQYTKAISEDEGQKLIESRAKDIIDWAAGEPINVVDLGCGDGKKAAGLIRAFKGKLKVRYCPIDISSYMVQKAIKTFSHESVAEVVDFQYNISDFDNLDNVLPLLKVEGYKKSLVLLLGNTLGNFEVNELLYEIRSSLSGADLLVIDAAVADEMVLDRAKSQGENAEVNNFLIKMPLQLGLEKKDLEYHTRFRNYRVEYYYTIKRDKTIKFNEKEIVFNKGDQIIVAVAYKYEKEDLMTYLNLYFNFVETSFSGDKSKVIALCKK